MVYTWVNGADPVWQQKRKAVTGEAMGDSDTDCKGRYTDNDELRYSLRSVEQNAPWIRKIFIVTDGQTPRWLDTENPKVEIVDHTKIMDPDILPTFNSVTIEHNIFKIPGLAEHFLYANDDLFICKPITPDYFFAADGNPYVMLNRRPLRRLAIWYKEKIRRKEISTYNKTILKSAKLIQREYGKYIGHKTHHNIDAYRKSTYGATFEKFSRDILPTLAHRTRTDDDVQRNIYAYAALMEKRAHRKFVSNKTSFKFHIENPGHYQKVERYDPVLLCMNDSENATDADRRRVREFMEERFPIRSSFERQ